EVDRDAGLGQLAVVDLAVGVRVDELRARDRDVLIVAELEPGGRTGPIGSVDRVVAAELVDAAAGGAGVGQRAVPAFLADLADLPGAGVDAEDRPVAVLVADSGRLGQL